MLIYTFYKKCMCNNTLHALGKKVVQCVVALAVALVLIMEVQAKPYNFETFTMDIPQDWTVQQSDGSIVNMRHPQNLCAATIMVVPHMGVSFRELGIAFYQNLQGKNVSGADEGMSFQLKVEGDIPSVARLSEQGEYFAAMTVTGQCTAYEAVFSSVRIRAKEGEFVIPSRRIYPLLTKTSK